MMEKTGPTQKILIYNWCPFDGNTGGGVTTYIRNIIGYITREHEDRQLYFLSSGSRYDLGRDRPYIRCDDVQPLPGCRCYSIVNSPVPAPASYIATDPENMFLDYGLKAVFRSFLLEHGPFSAIHFNNLEGISIDVLSLKAEFSETRFIFSLHNYMPFCPRVNLFDHRSRKNCLDYEQGSNCVGCVSAVKRRPSTERILEQVGAESGADAGSWLEKLHLSGIDGLCTAEGYVKYRTDNIAAINRYMDVVLAVSKRTYDIALRYGISKEKLRLDYIGTKIASQPRAPSLSCESEDAFKVAFLGSASQYEKGLMFFLDALGHIPPEAAKKISILVAGTALNKDRVLERLFPLFKASLFKSIEIHNGYSHDELPGLLKAVSLGVVPVLWEDNLPQVAIEMAALGVPVLASDLGGASELTESELFKFRAGDIEDFVSHILTFVNNKGALAQYWEHRVPLTTLSQHVDGTLLELYGISSGREV